MKPNDNGVQTFGGFLIFYFPVVWYERHGAMKEDEYAEGDYPYPVDKE